MAFTKRQKPSCAQANLRHHAAIKNVKSLVIRVLSVRRRGTVSAIYISTSSINRLLTAGFRIGPSGRDDRHDIIRRLTPTRLHAQRSLEP